MELIELCPTNELQYICSGIEWWMMSVCLSGTSLALWQPLGWYIQGHYDARLERAQVGSAQWTESMLLHDDYVSGVCKEELCSECVSEELCDEHHKCIRTARSVCE